jgi:acetyl-CoA carboxylase carboxyl transferase subunit alpha
MATVAHLDFEKRSPRSSSRSTGYRASRGSAGSTSARSSVAGAEAHSLKRDVFRNLSPIERVQVARHPRRPYTLDYLELIFTDFVELHGDRMYRDDASIVGGWARLDGETVMVIGHQKGRDMKENLLRNFGMPHPEGYRKALRLMNQAEKFGRPVGASSTRRVRIPGSGRGGAGSGGGDRTEPPGDGGAPRPSVAVVIGEGGSGGALAIGVADRVLMLENSVYSVISPEGCAAILWKSGSEREKAATALKLTAEDLFGLEVIDEVIPEPAGGAHSDWEQTARRSGVHAPPPRRAARAGRGRSCAAGAGRSTWRWASGVSPADVRAGT